MFKICIVFVALAAAVSAKPALVAAPVAYTAAAAPVAYTAGAPLAYTAAGVPVAYTAPVVTATSSQYVARNYNGVVAAPYVAAPYTYPYASAYSAYTYPYASAAYVV